MQERENPVIPHCKAAADLAGFACCMGLIIAKFKHLLNQKTNA
jgi:hypothetical protein